MFESKKNNVWFNIWNSLTASTSSTLLTILWWKETLFWADFWINDTTKHFKLTLTKFVWWVVSISEVVKVTAKSGNALTIVRAYEPCPINANATVMTQAPQVFDVWDFAYMNMTASDLIELWVLIDTKQNNCVMLTKSANYTFIWNEANNTWFSTNTTSWNITYSLNPALFPTTNGMYEFTICKSTNDVNTVIIDVWAWKTIDTVQTYILTNFMESVTIRIASSTFVKIIAATNRTVVVPAISTTQSTFTAWENIIAWNALRIHTDWKVYKTTLWSIFQWFASNTANTNENVIVDIQWVTTSLSWLSINSSYYLWSLSNWTPTTITTNSVSSTLNWTLSPTANVWQTFTMSESWTLQSITIRMRNDWSGSWSVSMSVLNWVWWSVLWTSTNTVANTSIWWSYSNFTFNFSNISLSATSWLYFKIIFSWSWSWWIYVQWDSTNNIYNWWGYYSNDTAWWTNADLWFILNYTPKSYVNWTISNTTEASSVKVWRAMWTNKLKIAENI